MGAQWGSKWFPAMSKMSARKLVLNAIKLSTPVITQSLSNRPIVLPPTSIIPHNRLFEASSGYNLHAWRMDDECANGTEDRLARMAQGR
jgi:hypothetical protein